MKVRVQTLFLLYKLYYCKKHLNKNKVTQESRQVTNKYKSFSKVRSVTKALHQMIVQIETSRLSLNDLCSLVDVQA